jgi:hypothetical protein
LWLWRFSAPQLLGLRFELHFEFGLFFGCRLVVACGTFNFWHVELGVLAVLAYIWLWVVAIACLNERFGMLAVEIAMLAWTFDG